MWVSQRAAKSIGRSFNASAKSAIGRVRVHNLKTDADESFPYSRAATYRIAFASPRREMGERGHMLALLDAGASDLREKRERTSGGLRRRYSVAKFAPSRERRCTSVILAVWHIEAVLAADFMHMAERAW